MTRNFTSRVLPVLLVLAAIAATYMVLAPAKTSDTDIRNVWWNVTEINGKKTTYPDRFRVMFDETGRVGGKSGCNNFGGGYALEGNTFKPTSGFVGTRMMCYPETVMQEEYEFLSALENITNLDVVDEGTLKLSGKENTSLLFVIEAE